MDIKIGFGLPEGMQGTKIFTPEELRRRAEAVNKPLRELKTESEIDDEIKRFEATQAVK